MGKSSMMPMRGIFAACCARAASGHAATPPSSVMNSRRLMPNTGFLLSVGLPHAQPAIEGLASLMGGPELF